MANKCKIFKINVDVNSYELNQLQRKSMKII